MSIDQSQPGFVMSRCWQRLRSVKGPKDVSRWFFEPHKALDGLTPTQALKAGLLNKVEWVVEEEIRAANSKAMERNL